MVDRVPNETLDRPDLSQRLTPGQLAPDFTLTAVDGKPVGLRADDRATVVVFTSNGCPYALAWHDRIQQVARDYAAQGVRVLQIMSNDPEHRPEDALGAIVARAAEYAGPVLLDADQAVAQAYGATATPDVFVVDADGRVRYHGAPDANHDDPAAGAGWLRDALDDVLAGRPVARPSTSATGCAIKWRVEVLWWDGCPSHGEAESLLRQTLSELGREDVSVGRRQVRNRSEAETFGFPGSPTYQVGRRDLFPVDAPAGLTCRVYRRADGRAAPLPDAPELAQALRGALARPWDLPGWVARGPRIVQTEH